MQSWLSNSLTFLHSHATWFRATMGLMVALAISLGVSEGAVAQRASGNPPRLGGRIDNNPNTMTDLRIDRAVAGRARYDDSAWVIPVIVEIGNTGRATTASITAQARYQIDNQHPVTTRIMSDNRVAAVAGLGTNRSATLEGEFRISDPRGQWAGKSIRLSIQIDPSNSVGDSNGRNNVSAPIEVVLPSLPNPRRPNRPDRIPRPPQQPPTSPPLVAGNPTGPVGGGLRPGENMGGANGNNTNVPPSSGHAGPQGLANNKVLADVYRANDGGAYFVHTIDKQVYIFGEHPGLGYAVVIEGTIDGQMIHGSYWDVPKGTRANRGSVKLQIQNSGQRLVVHHSTGGFTITHLEPYAIQNHQLPRANRTPGFYTTKADDLDGAWRTGSQHLYIREVDGKVIGWLESQFASGDKPVTASIMIGDRTQSNQVLFKQVSVPKGQGHGSRQTSFIVQDAFHIRQLGGAVFVKDIMNFEKFGNEIIARFKNESVGFGYAIAHEGKIVQSGGWGNRLLAMDGGPLPFTADTQKCTQSTSKTITAAAIIHLLHSKGMSVDDKIIDYLPKYWEKGPMTEHLTFAHLLRQRSGLTDYGDPDEYASLKQTIKTGPSNMNWIVPQFEYRNSNFALFRIIIPYLDKPSDMHNFEQNGLRGDSINERCSTRYLHYVRDHILLPAGIANPQANYTSNNKAYSYNYLNQNVAGYPQQAGQLYEMGAGSWVLSAKDYALFLAALENGVILPKDRVAEMKSKGLGLYTTSSVIGTVFMHGGSIGGNQSDSYGHGRGARAQSMMFPNNVQVFITFNSANNVGAAESTGARAKALADAFAAAMY